MAKISTSYKGGINMELNTQKIYETLVTSYNITIGKDELAQILNVSVSYINKCIMQGKGIPNYKKLSSARNAKIIWNLADVADYITDTTKMYG